MVGLFKKQIQTVYMSLKLTDKEISALAKKIADKKQKEATKKITEAAKKKLPEAKKISAMISSLPEEVINLIDETRYDKGRRTVQNIADRLARKEELLEKIEAKNYESDVILAAHGCTTLTQLCSKLGI
jgi:leucyl aminopeptidase (aminopeptidase T)